MRVESGRSTLLRRSRESKAPMAIAGVVTMVVGGLLFAFEHQIAGSMVAIFGLLIVGGALSPAYDAECPVCDALVSGIAKEGLASCAGCKSYLRAHDERLWPLEENYVAKSARFAIALREHKAHAMPRVCCMCGAPATHQEGVTFTSATVGGTMIRALDVPYCGEHTKGAELGFWSSNDNKFLKLGVASYRFYMQFLEINDLLPKERR